MSVDKKPILQIKTSTIVNSLLNHTIDNNSIGVTGAIGPTGSNGATGTSGIAGSAGPPGATGQVNGTVLFWNNALQGITGTIQYLGWGSLPQAGAGSQIILPYGGHLSSMYAVTTDFNTGNNASPSSAVTFATTINGIASPQNVTINSNASTNNNTNVVLPVYAGFVVGMRANSSGANCGGIVSIMYTYTTDLPV